VINPKDTLKSFIARGKIKAKFIDSNSIRVTLPKGKSPASLRLWRRRVFFEM